MKVIINGEVCFTGTEKECLNYARNLADSRRKSEPGKQISKIYQHGRWSWRDQTIIWERNKQILRPEDIRIKANWPPMKFEFAA